MDTADSVHFRAREFACKDKCGWVGVSPLLVRRLELLRRELGKPVPISSGRRCPVHNAAVGGASRSRHVYGDAVDIPQALGVTEALARRVGFTGIGKQRNGIVTHVDVRPARTVTVWVYE